MLSGTDLAHRCWLCKTACNMLMKVPTFRVGCVRRRRVRHDAVACCCPMVCHAVAADAAAPHRVDDDDPAADGIAGGATALAAVDVADATAPIAGGCCWL